jgi:hypothetical protein
MYMVSMKEDNKPSNDQVYTLKPLNHKCESNKRLFLNGAISLIVEAKVIAIPFCFTEASRHQLLYSYPTKLSW